MVSISKIALLLSLLLTILFSLQLKGSEDEVAPSEVEKGLIPNKVNVAISNFLLSKDLTVHCKDKHNDLGTHILKYGETYDFGFRPNIFWKVTLYFCRFTWVGASHSFDVYKQDRDECDQCVWNILESGPCKVYPKHNQCYVWKN
ncbi:hypothetical protein LR48_Vigan102s004400 [Vigna angularis]|uniref:S-protein homolog n=2 Tax=Phaseolus angularis TaxID=3914 RepID=A0A0L9T4V9_PHAAN|nr:hypothetical protein LR48_Vigan102s004400 [Vigna angularis]BAU00920.1 hypothetical protein VIGAN_11005900 [Vigna angularis var. angularis]